jgi:UDP-N-acetylmuramyl tripeptide synthase
MIDPALVTHLSSDQHRKAIVITGTNGKTTTTHIIQQGVLNVHGTAAYDPSSTNMVQGVATTLCLDSTTGGSRRSEWAVIESDEGASKALVPALVPQVMVVTNFYRDQIDRYASDTAARDYVVAAAQASPETTLVLDADCQVTASIAEHVDNPIVWYGVDCDIYGSGIADHDEAVRCVECGGTLSFSHGTFAHLGDWSCPSCERRRPEPGISCIGVKNATKTGCDLVLRIDGEEHEVHANIRAGYDVYNAVAAVAGMLTAGISKDDAFRALGRFRHAAHRFEMFDVSGTRVRLLLVKNTAGCNQLLNMLSSEEEPPTELVCLLGAEIMDGRDTGWIRDVRWEKICKKESHVIVGGPKWEDMRNRLLETGIPEDSISVEADYGRLVAMLDGSDAEDVTVIANCSTIEALRLTMVKRGYKPIDYWSDDTPA